MLRIALFAIFIAQQFGQGAYYGEMYLILPIISALAIDRKSTFAKATNKKDNK